ncbi:MAG: hypothetical protein HYS56_02000 [Candidatus Omnitrophica bacterium]|nr:hypothetical protein [Candidatus Omnitrophota bacterium]
MKTRWIYAAGIALVIGLFAFQPLSWAKKKTQEQAGHDHAKEHGGQEHGGTAVQEHGGTAMAPTVAEPAPEAIRSAISSYIETAAQANGSYSITDPVTGNVRNLQLVQVHERVGKTGDYYYSCTDMKDVNSGETLDLDFDVANDSGTLRVLPDKVRIHKVDGNPRYTYDANDNMIPVAEGTAQEGTAPSEAQPAPEPVEVPEK